VYIVQQNSPSFERQNLNEPALLHTILQMTAQIHQHHHHHHHHQAVSIQLSSGG
jgi:hypothetical protein